MLEIIPNVHPIFVHFTVALCSTAVLFYILSYISNWFKISQKIFTVEFEVVARWCLWSVAFITIFTVIYHVYCNYRKHNYISAAKLPNYNVFNFYRATNRQSG